MLVQPEYKWIACQNGNVPTGATPIGETLHGETLYAERVRAHGALTVGKVSFHLSLLIFI